jgi:hypothetical protein
LDLAGQRSVPAGIDEIMAEAGRVDVVLHASGPVPCGPVESFTPFQRPAANLPAGSRSPSPSLWLSPRRQELMRSREIRLSVNGAVNEYAVVVVERPGESGRERGHVRTRGGSHQVRVYSGVDPVTGKDVYLSESTRDKKKVDEIRTRLLAKVDKQRTAVRRTRGGDPLGVDRQ